MPERRADPESEAWVQATSAAIARGDRAALAEFYGHWFGRCFATARSITGRDESFCLDVVQDTMLRVIKSMRPMRSAPELSAWMGRATHSAALDLLRRDSRRLRRELARGGKAAEAQAAATDERISWLIAALKDLPSGDGALVALRVGSGRTLEAVGAASGLSGDAAHGRLRRAFERLRKRAREDGHD